MASFNKLIAVGYLGRDPELKYSAQGTAVCDFSVATTERQKDKSGEYKDTVTWFRVVFFGKQAETASQYLSKGSQVYIEGRLSQREWQDREGNTRTSLEVTGTDMKFLGTKGEEKPQRAAAPAEKQAAAEIDESDVPFMWIGAAFLTAKTLLMIGSQYLA